MSKDLFSNHASLYAAFRPTYPSALYDFIFRFVKTPSLAWDAGTGNGQVARDLVERVDRVIATDISEKQLAQAFQHERITYQIAGETVELPDQCADLISVAQAIHWFDREKFYREAKRVGKPDGVIAIWGYNLPTSCLPLDAILLQFYREVVGPYWDAERKLVEDEYRSISFPFREIQTPAFSFSTQWSLDELLGYVSSWSATQKYIKSNQTNPVEGLRERFAKHPMPDKFQVTFPIFLRIGYIN